MLTLVCRIVFFPIWIFHAVVARGRFSLPAPAVPYNRHVRLNVSVPRWRKSKRLVIYLFLNKIFLKLQKKNFFLFLWTLIKFVVKFEMRFIFLGQWAPCHAIVATPLLIAFELLLCTYLESVYGMYEDPAVVFVLFEGLTMIFSHLPFPFSVFF